MNTKEFTELDKCKTKKGRPKKQLAQSDKEYSEMLIDGLIEEFINKENI